MKKKNVEMISLEKLTNKHSELQSSVRVTYKIHPETAQRIQHLPGANNTIRQGLDLSFLTLGVYLLDSELTNKGFAFIKDLSQSDEHDFFDAIETYSKSKLKNKIVRFDGWVEYCYDDTESFIRDFMTNVFNRKNTKAKTFVVSSFTKRIVDFLSLSFDIDKSTTFEFLVYCLYKTFHGKRLEKERANYPRYLAAMEILEELTEQHRVASQKLNEIIEYDGEALPLVPSEESYKKYSPIDIAMAGFNFSEDYLTQTALCACTDAVEQSKTFLEKAGVDVTSLEAGDKS